MARRTKWHSTAAIVIVLMAFALRMYRLEERAVWYDEAFSVFLSEQGLDRIIIGTAADIQPPLYYVLLHYWQAVGGRTSVMRFLSVSFSVLSVALVCALGTRLFSQDAGLFAMLFAAISPFQIYYAQELRMYALLELALLVYFYAFVKLAEGVTASGFRGAIPERVSPSHRWGLGGRTRMMLLLAVSGAVALYAQSLAVLTWLVPDIYVLFRRERALFGQLLVAQGLGLLLFLPWLAVQAGQTLNVQRSYWTTPPGLAEGLQVLLAFTVNQPLPAWLLPSALFITLAADAIIALEVIRAWRRKAPAGLALTMAFLVLPPLLMFAVSYAFRSIFVVRALILSSAAFALVLGRLFAASRNVVARAGCTLAAVAIAGSALAFQLSYDEFPRSPFDAADAYLQANVKPTDAVVHDNKLSYFPMRYYDRSLPQDWLADPPEAGSNTLSPSTMETLGVFPVDLGRGTSARSRVWFVIFQRAIDEATAEGHAPGNKAWMDANYTQLALVRFNDLNLYLYEK